MVILVRKKESAFITSLRRRWYFSYKRANVRDFGICNKNGLSNLQELRLPKNYCALSGYLFSVSTHEKISEAYAHTHPSVISVLNFEFQSNNMKMITLSRISNLYAFRASLYSCFNFCVILVPHHHPSQSQQGY